MINFLTILLCLTITIVYITDITDWPITIKKLISLLLTKGVSKKTDYRLHLVDCSACQTWWIGVLLMIFFGLAGKFSVLMLPATALTACATITIKNIILLVFTAIDDVVAWLTKKL